MTPRFLDDWLETNLGRNMKEAMQLFKRMGESYKVRATT
jgi:hypothetical protein